MISVVTRIRIAAMLNPGIGFHFPTPRPIRPISWSWTSLHPVSCQACWSARSAPASSSTARRPSAICTWPSASRYASSPFLSPIPGRYGEPPLRSSPDFMRFVTPSDAVHPSRPIEFPSHFSNFLSSGINGILMLDSGCGNTGGLSVTMPPRKSSRLLGSGGAQARTNVFALPSLS